MRPDPLSPDTDNRHQVDIHILRIWKDHVPVPDKPGEFKEVHKIEWAKRGTTATTVEKVSRVQKNEALWERVEPAYQRWLKGQETPADGTPLEAWAGVTPGQVDYMRSLHIRSVEDLAGCNDAALERIGMGARALRDRARAYVENKKGSAVIEAALAARNEEVDQLRQQVAELTALVQTKRGRKAAEAEA
jgi:hypothetical protein